MCVGVCARVSVVRGRASVLGTEGGRKNKGSCGDFIFLFPPRMSLSVPSFKFAKQRVYYIHICICIETRFGQKRKQYIL